jgi:hypothetical protein
MTNEMLFLALSCIYEDILKMVFPCTPLPHKVDAKRNNTISTRRFRNVSFLFRRDKLGKVCEASEFWRFRVLLVCNYSYTKNSDIYGYEG